jgi:UDP-N-acetyl-D-mannosaminuronic acid dehydrogenase
VIDPETLGRHVDGAAVAATLADAVAGASLVLIANNHPSLGALPPRAMLQVMAPGGFIYDYWNHFSNLSSSELAGAYFAVGHLGGGR